MINLANCLKESGFEVQVYWIDTGGFNPGIAYAWSRRLVINSFAAKILAKLRLLNAIKVLLLFRGIKKDKQFSNIVGVDPIGYIVAKLCGARCIWLSLEARRDFWHRLACALGVDDLIIQSERRGNYLFANSPRFPRMTLLPNSPRYVASSEVSKRKSPDSSGIKFIYFGNIIKVHGVEQCVEAVFEYGCGSSLTLHGPITDDYKKVLESKYRSLIGTRIFIRSDYVDQKSIVSYLARFNIGFVTYDWERSRIDFNYQTCPSGKMYNYFNAGLPVVGSDIVGLQDVARFEAGLLVNTDDKVEILGAINAIVKDYTRYALNSKEAAKFFDFVERFNSAVLPLFRLQHEVE